MEDTDDIPPHHEEQRYVLLDEVIDLVEDGIERVEAGENPTFEEFKEQLLKLSHTLEVLNKQQVNT